MFSITPEAFNAVDMVTPFRSSLLFPDDDMRASHREASLSLPVIRIVEASRQGMLNDQLLDSRPPAPLNREDSDHPVTMKDTEHDHFPGSTPAALSFAMAAKHRLIALDLPGERSGAFFGDAQYLPDHTEELFNSRARGRATEAP